MYVAQTCSPQGLSWLILSESGSALRESNRALQLDALRSTYASIVGNIEEFVVANEEGSIRDIDRDVTRTFSGEGNEEQVVEARRALRPVLVVLALTDPDLGYCQGLNFLCATVLRELPEADAFCLVSRLLYGPLYHMRGMYLHGLPDVSVHSQVLNALLQQLLPHIYGHLEEVGVESQFLFDWYFTLFSLLLPPTQLRGAIKAFLSDGWPAIYATVLVLLQHLWPYLEGKDAFGTISALKAYNNAQLAVSFPGLDLPTALPSSLAVGNRQAQPAAQQAQAQVGKQWAIAATLHGWRSACDSASPAASGAHHPPAVAASALPSAQGRSLSALPGSGQGQAGTRGGDTPLVVQPPADLLDRARALQKVPQLSASAIDALWKQAQAQAVSRVQGQGGAGRVHTEGGE